MNDSNEVSLENKKEAKLPRRDWILLPMISLLTIALLAGSTELIAHYMSSGSTTDIADCMVKNDPQHGARGIPNCVCWGKTLETEEVEYRLNSHGFRTGMEWGPKEPGVYRIVMIGSSIAMGYRVARNKMFAELLPGEISKRTGRKVDLYNKGVMWGTPHSITLRFDDVLAAEPDSILWVLSETDIKEASALLPLQEPRMSHAEPANALDRRFGSLRRFRMALATESIPDAIGDMLKNTGARVLLQHYLNESQSQYLKSYLSGQEEAGFLRAEPSRARSG